MSRWFGPLAIAVCCYGGWSAWTEREAVQPPGVLAPAEPVQRALSRDANDPIALNGWRLTPVAQFQVEARLLRRERYYADTTAGISPVDFALGWGRMSDSAVLADLDITQGARFFHYRYRQAPIPQDEIVRSASNMHMIPASAQIERELLRARNGQMVRFRGLLVNASRGDGGEWRSSTTRTDSGAGACEIVYVTEFSASDR